MKRQKLEHLRDKMLQLSDKYGFQLDNDLMVQLVGLFGNEDMLPDLLDLFDDVLVEVVSYDTSLLPLLLPYKKDLQYFQPSHTDKVDQLLAGHVSPDQLRREPREIAGRLMPAMGPVQEMKYTMTQELRVKINELLDQLGQPILIKGPSSSGKSMMVQKIAAQLGQKLITLHLTPQTDVKSLTGQYVMANEQERMFKFQEGALTKAVREGWWVLIEDMDAINQDVIPFLSSLMDIGHLRCGSDGSMVVHCATGFQLFGTTQADRKFNGWSEVEMQSFNQVDRFLILGQKFPDVLQSTLIWICKGFDAVASSQENLQRVNGRKPDLHQLMLWIQRVQEFVICDPELTYQQRLQVFGFGVDIMSGMLSDHQVRLRIAMELGQSLGVSEESVIWYMEQRIPDIKQQDSEFVVTSYSAKVLEQVMNAVHSSQKDPLLLVGETGQGKTTVVQYLAQQMGKSLTVVNMSQQSDSSDLLGGYKPVDIKIHVVLPMKENFDEGFAQTFSVDDNQKFMDAQRKAWVSQNWKRLLQCWKLGMQMFRKKNLESDIWLQVEQDIKQLELIVQQQGKLMFQFVEGSLTRAIKNGDWILLDEINMSPAETLQCLSSVLESTTSSVILSERGDIQPVERHPNFRMFACMNPNTDVGKRQLPNGIRARFTELWIGGPEDNIELSIVDGELNIQQGQSYQDLALIVARYLQPLFGFIDQKVPSDASRTLHAIVKFYLHARYLVSQHNLTVGETNQKPHYSIRTLARCLRHAAKLTQTYGPMKGLYESVYLVVLAPLSAESLIKMKGLLCQYLFQDYTKQQVKHMLQTSPRAPSGLTPAQVKSKFKPMYEYFVMKGNTAITVKQQEFIDQYIITPSISANLHNLTRAVVSDYPVLIEGPTSAGKTSMIEYMAILTGNKFVRINNHEHTDLQEYIGSYVWDEIECKFKFQEGILVQALRQGWWIVLDELNLAPGDVLEALNRLLDDNRELFIAETGVTVKPAPQFKLFATQNPSGSVYGGRKTLSRAFRNRFVELHYSNIPLNELEVILHKRCHIAPSYAKKMVAVFSDLQKQRSLTSIFSGKDGYMTLRDLFRWALRQDEAGEQILGEDGYILLGERIRDQQERLMIGQVIEKHIRCKLNMEAVYENVRIPQVASMPIISTMAMKRLYFLVNRAIKNNEPVLLIGETGCGKTTVVQLMAALQYKSLHIYNCHQHTETSDFIGCMRPVRQSGNAEKLFQWYDGSLLQALKNGDLFLLDEISLAEDSVLERLNSVLEPSRSLTVTESNGNDIQVVQAQPGFQFFGTMNPGGDFGKKELSPALRNRFTEIWVGEAWQNSEDLSLLIDGCLPQDLNDQARDQLVTKEIEFLQNFESTVSLRDVLAWNEFISYNALNGVPLAQCYEDGQSMVLMDGCYMSVSDFKVIRSGSRVGILPYLIETGRLQEPDSFLFDAPTTAMNAFKIFRAMSVPKSKPILLEGNPGCGKTTLVQALAKLCGHNLVRLNLSEQTDLSDLFGNDMPVDSTISNQLFEWRDGPLLQAMKNGDWVLLDELNLASQSVLEGLNAVLDHRSEVFVPELNLTFKCGEGFRLFGAQNPYSQGGGRKGLPKSFLNRFVKVQVETLTSTDMLHIASGLFPEVVPTDVLQKMIDFNAAVAQATMCDFTIGAVGRPWEFNLRDVFRWLQLVQMEGSSRLEKFVELIYMQRFRTLVDRQMVRQLYCQVFGTDHMFEQSLVYNITQDKLQIGDLTLSRGSSIDRPLLVKEVLPFAYQLLLCTSMNWMTMLVGKYQAVKVARQAAFMVGRGLVELSVNQSTDSQDLIGTFDQFDVGRYQRRVMAVLYDMINNSTSLDVLQQVKVLQDLNNERWCDVAESLNVPELQDAIHRIRTAKQSKEVQFEWVDGPLVQAMLQGSWLIVHSANLCNPSVLDRLNSLMEPNGVLYIAEQGVINGKVRKIVPHQDFRLILCVDTGLHGELSRAMRNRGIKLHVDFEAGSSEQYLYEPLKHIGSKLQNIDRNGTVLIQSHVTSLLSGFELPPSIVSEFKLPAQVGQFTVDHMNEHLSDQLQQAMCRELLRLVDCEVDIEDEVLDVAMRSCHDVVNDMQGWQVLNLSKTLLVYKVSGMIKESIYVDASLLLHIVEVFREVPSFNLDQLESLIGQTVQYDSTIAIWNEFNAGLIVKDEATFGLLQKLRTVHDRLIGDSSDRAWELKHLLRQASVDLLKFGKDVHEEVQAVCDVASEYDKVDLVMPKSLEVLIKRNSLVEECNMDNSLRYIVPFLAGTSKAKSSAWLNCAAGEFEFGNVLAALTPASVSEALCLSRNCSLSQYDYSMQVSEKVLRLVKQPVVLKNIHQLLSQFGSADVFESAFQLLESYIPNAAFDPGMQHFVETVQLELQIDDIDAQLSASERLLHEFASQTSKDVMLNLIMKKTELEQAISVLRATNAYRPEQSKISKFYSEVFSFMKIIRRESVSETLISESRISIVEQSIRDFVQRMSTAFPEYQDIMSPIEAFMMLLLAGFSQVKHQMRKAPQDVQVALLSIFELPDQLDQHSVMDSVTTITSQLSKKDEVVMQLVLNELAKYSDMKLDRNACYQLDHHLGYILADWTEKADKKAQQLALDTSLYKFHADSEDDQLEEDQVELEHQKEWLDQDGQLCLDKEVEHKSDQVRLPASLLVQTYLSVFGKGSISESERLQKLAGVMSQLTITVDQSVEQPLLLLNVITMSNMPKNQHSEEFAKVSALLDKFLIRLSELLIVWPDNPVLAQLQVIASRILKFRISYPLVKVLVGLEILLSKAYEWQEYASKELSLQEDIDSITTLIIQWRRQELENWSSALEQQHDDMLERTSKLWYHLYRTCFSEGTGDDHFTNVVETLYAFMSQSCIGEFHYRLSMLEAFVSHLGYYEGVLRQALVNIVAIFSQYKDHVQKTIEQLKQPILEELVDLVKLTSWKDVNYQSLKLGIQQSKSKLARLVRKYRQNVLEVSLEVVKSKFAPPSFVVAQSPKVHVAIECVCMSSGLILGKFEPKQLVDKMAKFGQETIQKIDGEEFWLLSEHIVHEIQMFQQDNKKFSNATEENVGQIKNLRKMKQNAMVQLLRTLKLMGLSKPPVRGCVTVTDIALLQGGDDKLHPIVTKLQHMRTLIPKANPQVDRQHVQKLAGFVEDLLVKLGQIRQPLSEFGQSSTKISSCARYLKVCQYQGVKYVDQNLSFVVSGLHSILLALKQFKLASQLAGCTSVLRYGSKLQSLFEQASELTFNHGSIFSSAHMKLVINLIDLLLELPKSGVPKFDQFVEQYVGKLLQIGFGNDIPAGTSDDLANVVLLSMQDLKSIQVDVELIDEELQLSKASVTKACQLLVRAVELSRVKEVTAQLQVYRGSDLEQLLPLLLVYSQIMEGLQAKIQHLYQGLQVLLNTLVDTATLVFTNGYCLPENFEEDDQQGKEEQELEGGTGMAANEQGQKDVSDEIEDEEQVLGLEGEENDERDVDQEEDGLDMQNDFDGNMHSMEQQPDDQSNEDGESLDEDMGDLSNDQTDVVDEKLWNEDEEPATSGEDKTDTNAADADGAGEKQVAAQTGEPDSSEPQEDDYKDQDFGSDQEELINEDPADQDFDSNNVEARGEGQPESEEDPMDLDDDMNLGGGDGGDMLDESSQDGSQAPDLDIDSGAQDDNEDTEGQEEDEIQQDNPMADLDNDKGDVPHEDPMEVDGEKQETIKDTRTSQDATYGVQGQESNQSATLDGQQEAAQASEEQGQSASVEQQISHSQIPSAGQSSKQRDTTVNENRSLSEALEDLKQRRSAFENSQKREDATEQEVVDVEYAEQDNEAVDGMAALGTATAEQMTADQVGGKAEDPTEEYQQQPEAEEPDVELNESSSLSVPMPLPQQSTSTQELEAVDDERILDVEEDLDMSGCNFANVELSRERYQVQDRVEESLPEQLEELELYSKSKKLWMSSQARTSQLSFQLCEQLRLVLEPTVNSHLQGDYKSGKRLNMRKIIPYIASQYRKDKIWMRRQKPRKRSYQVLLSIDDSKSMQENNTITLAFDSLAIISKALSLLEVGQVGVASFGSSVQLLHDFDKPLSTESGIEVIERFTFGQEKTSVMQLMKETVKLMDQERLKASVQDLWQLHIVISDGLCEDHDRVKCQVRESMEDYKILTLFVIIDTKEGIQTMKNVNFVDGELRMTNYMDTFPFDFYVVVRDVNTMPELIANALRQWFEMVTR